MEEQMKLLLTSIFAALLAHARSGRFSVSWGYTPPGSFNLNGLAEDGTPLFDLIIDSRLLNKLRSRLSAEATDDAKH